VSPPVLVCHPQGIGNKTSFTLLIGLLFLLLLIFFSKYVDLVQEQNRIAHVLRVTDVPQDCRILNLT
jgi:hypothetical protein